MSRVDQQLDYQIKTLHETAQAVVETMKRHRRFKDKVAGVREGDVRVAVASMLANLENMARVDA